MPGLLRFLPQIYTQTEDLLKNITLDIKTNKQTNQNKPAAPEITAKSNNKLKSNYIIHLC